MSREARDLTLSAIDQALLSALSLGVAVSFIRLASKEEYGRYTLMNGLVMLMSGVQAALVATPLTTMGARMEAAGREGFVAAVFRLQALLAIGLAVALAIGTWGGAGVDHAAALALGVAVAVVGALLREFQRTVGYLRREAGAVLAGDAIYCASAAAGLLLAARLRGTLEARWALWALGVAALVPGARALAGGRSRPAPTAIPDARGVLRGLIGQGRWTLPGMAVTWGQNTGYVYIVAAMAGSAAVADLAAARLFITPISLLVAAWQRVFMPQAGALLARGDAAAVLARCRRDTRALAAATCAYVGGLLVFFRLGGAGLLPAKYAGLGPLVAAWCAFLLANTIRTVAAAALMSHVAFRALFWSCAVAAAVSLLLLGALARAMGPAGAVYGLAAGELLLAWFSWTALTRRTHV